MIVYFYIMILRKLKLNCSIKSIIHHRFDRKIFSDFKIEVLCYSFSNFLCEIKIKFENWQYTAYTVCLVRQNYLWVPNDESALFIDGFIKMCVCAQCSYDAIVSPLKLNSPSTIGNYLSLWLSCGVKILFLFRVLK